MIKIYEKYKTPSVQYKNFMSTIVLINENALRVENDDRHTVFLNVSLTCKEDIQYFKNLETQSSIQESKRFSMLT
jgi:hypothetical protein